MLRSVDSLVGKGLSAAVVAFAIVVARLDGPIDAGGRHFGGDFLNFYTAGSMVLEGRGHALYDLGAQSDAQRELLWPATWTRLAPYVNPPILALAWAPIAALPFKAAYVVSVVALCAVLLAGLHALRPQVPALHSRWFIVVGLCVLFLPIFRTVTGGQNTVITFALLAAGYASLRSGRDARAGVWLGLLLYKPQYAVLPALLLLVCRRWAAVTGFAAVGAAQYALGVAIAGIDWPIRLAALLPTVMPEISAADGAQLIAWLNVSQYALPAGVALPVAAVLCALMFGWLAFAWFRRSTDPRRQTTALLTTPDPRSPRFAYAFGAMICVSISCGPHAQWYDAGLLLIPALLGLDGWLTHVGAIDGPTRWGLIAGFFSVPLYWLAPLLGWQPLALLSPIVLLWLHRVDQYEDAI